MATQVQIRPPRAVRFFASEASAPRIRRLSDGVDLVLVLAAIIALAWWAVPTRPFEQSLTDGLAASPAWLVKLWVLIYDFAVALAPVVLLAALFRRRWPVLLEGLMAAALALVGVVLTVGWSTGNWPSLTDAGGAGSAVVWPAAALALAAAPLYTVSPDLTEPMRRFVSRTIVAGGIAYMLAGRATPTAVLAAILIAMAAAAMARLVIGTTAGRLTGHDVLALVGALGVSIGEIAVLKRRMDGLILVETTGPDDEPLYVKVHGRDAAESRLVLRLWRTLAYRDGGTTLGHARVPGLEHETLATLLAAARGAPVWPVVAAGRPAGPDEALVLHRSGTRLADVASGAFEARDAGAAWQALAATHAAGVAHLGITAHSMAWLDDRSVVFTDLEEAVIAPGPERLHTDRAQLFVLLATLVGADAALDSAEAALGQENLAAMLPYVQTAALPTTLRVAVHGARLDIEAFRKVAAERAGVSEPELAKLRRLSWGSLIRTGLLILAAGTILSAASNLDREELANELAGASIALIVVGFIVAQTPRFTQAISTLGSVPARLPLGPVYVMQLATSFLNIALPSAAARMALNIRFFQRQGVPPGTAVTSGLIASFVGNAVQAVMLIGILAFSSISFDVPGSEPSSGGDSSHSFILALILLALAALAVGIVLAITVKRYRRAVVAKWHAWWPDVRASLKPLQDPQKLLQLLGGSVATELLFALALWIFVAAIGTDISLVDALYVNLAASLIAMFIPIPGGIGVTEGAMVYGLTGLGVSQETAFAAVIVYRIATFYLPPAWGYFAMQWLEKKRYI